MERAVDRPRGVGVDPLMIPCGIGEQVHLLLRNLHPVGSAQGPPDETQQIGRLVHYGVHRGPFATTSPVASIVTPVRLVVVVVANSFDGPVMCRDTPPKESVPVMRTQPARA